MAGEDRNANVVLTADVGQYSQQMTQAATQTNSVTASVNRLIETLDKAQKTTGKGLTIVSATTLATITGATVAAARFEQQLSSLSARAVAANQAFGTTQRAVDSLRRSLPVSTEQVIALSNALQKLGTNPSRLREVSDTLIRLSGATNEDLGSLANGMITLQRAMGTSSNGIKQYSDLLVNLSANMGTSASSVLEFANAIAPIGRTLNMTQQEVMGFSAAFSKAGQDGLLASNIFTKMLSDISTATRYGTKELSMYAGIVGKTVDEFKSMGSTNQVAAIFDALNKGGAQSIKTLERMGFEGARSLKVIQGTVQSGSVDQALGIANNPSMQTGDTLKKASDDAFDGVNDNIKRMQNSFTSLAQSFGATFLPVMKSVTSTMADLADTMVKALAPIQPLLGAMGAGLATVSGGMGAIVSTLGPLAAVAAGYALYRNSAGAGRSAARWMNDPKRNIPGVYANTARSISGGAGSGFQRGLFAFGAGRGGGDLNRMMGGETTAAQRAMFQAGRFMTAASPIGLLSRAFPSVEGGNRVGTGLRDIARRGFAVVGGGINTLTGFGSASFSDLRPDRMSDITRRGAGNWSMAGDRFRAAWSGGPEASIGNTMRSMGAGLGIFAKNVGLASVGAAKLGVSATVAATKMAGGALGRGIWGTKDPTTGMRAGGLMGLAGGPAGIALLGGMALMQMNSTTRAQNEDFYNATKSSDGAKSAYNAYATALGLAGAAAKQFSVALTGATNTVLSVEESKRWSASKGSSFSGRKLVDESVGSMTAKEATSYVASALSNSNADPRAIQAMRLDIEQKFGDTTGQAIWAGAQSKGIGFEDFFVGKADTSSVNRELRGLMPFIPSRKEWGEGIETAGDTIDTVRGEISARGLGAEEELKANMAFVNSMMAGLNEAANDTDAQKIKIAMANKMGLDAKTADFDSLKFMNSDWDGLYRMSDEEIATAAKEFMIANKRLTAQEYESLSAEEQTARSYKFGGVETVRDSPSAVDQRTTMAGTMFWDQGVRGQTLQAGAYEEGNENANIQASRLWAEELTKSTGSAAAASAELQRLKGVVGDLSNPLSVAASAAQEFARKLQSRELIGQGTTARVRANVTGLRNATAAPDTDEYQKNLQAAQDQLWTDYEMVTSMVQNVVKAGRAFNQSESWSKQDFGLSMERQEEDFYRSRERQDADYARSRKRAYEDFNLSRKHAEDDFNRSRKRSEEDFNHQKELMARQTAKSMADVYSRINVQQTWDAQNLVMNVQDQAARFSKQIEDLKKLRKMGISSEAIKMLGLNDPRNAQQVARMVQDLQTMPELVGQFNQAAQDRLDIAGMFTFDEDNETWAEMQRSFDLAADRAAEDFERMAKRGADAFQKAMDRQSEDYKRMTKQQQADFNRSVERATDDFEKQLKRSRTLFNQQFEEVNGDLRELQTEALGYLGGAALEQMDATIRSFTGLGDELVAEAERQAKAINEVFSKGFVNPYSAKAVREQQYAPYTGQYTGGGKVPSGHGENDTWSGGNDSYGGNDYLSYGPMSPMPSQFRAGTGSLQKYGAPRPGGRKHEGTDFPAPVGTSIYAVLPGVASTRWSQTGGNVTSINHGNGLYTKYLHQSSYAIRDGEKVDAGQKIGGVGNTGSASRGAHLHFEVRKGGDFGTSIDPVAWLGGAVGTDNSSTEVNGGRYLSPDGLKKWDAYVTDQMKSVEALTAQHMQMTKELPPGTATAGTIAATHVGLNNLGYLGSGAIFDRNSAYGVGERGSELLLPLDAKGSDYLAETMMKYAGRVDMRAQGMETVSAPTNNTYTQTVDSSVNFNGEMHVEASDPNEMARKLEEKARLQRLTKR